jgi:hypothetical protein
MDSIGSITTSIPTESLGRSGIPPVGNEQPSSTPGATESSDSSGAKEGGTSSGVGGSGWRPYF